MNVPYNEINLTDAAKRIGVDYSTIAGWCRKGLINFIDLSEGTTKPRYMLLEKEVDKLKSERKKNGKYFIRTYDKDWDSPKEISASNYEAPEYEEDNNEYPPSEVLEGHTTVSQHEDIPTRKKFNLDDITATISYMQDINDRLAALEIEKADLLEKLNDIDAEKNQLTNEYSQLKSEIVEKL